MEQDFTFIRNRDGKLLDKEEMAEDIRLYMRDWKEQRKLQYERKRKGRRKQRRDL